MILVFIFLLMLCKMRRSNKTHFWVIFVQFCSFFGLRYLIFCLSWLFLFGFECLNWNSEKCVFVDNFFLTEIVANMGFKQIISCAQLKSWCMQILLKIRNWFLLKISIMFILIQNIAIKITAAIVINWMP